MGAIGTGVTYLDLARRLDPDDKIAAIIELLSETNEILQDMIVVEGNLPTGHKTTVRTGLPSATWRKLNYGVQPSKSTTKQVTDSCGMLEAYAEVDKALADLNGNTAAFRLSEDRAFLETMNQEMGNTVFYGNTDQYPERFMGVTPRYAALGTDKTKISYNVVNAYASAADADQTSMWLIVWGNNTVHGIYPKGSKAGFTQEDKGQVTLEDANGGRYEGYRTHYKWELGLTVRDWRYAVRIANIDTSALNATTVDLINAMIDAYYKIPNINMGRAAFYANQTVSAALHKQALEKSTFLRIDEVGGKPVVNMWGIPIRRVDALLNTEAVVS
jgi:hypothetical protein